MFDQGLAPFYRQLNSPIAGATLLALIALAQPAPSTAQVPAFPTPNNASIAAPVQAQVPSTYRLGPGDRLQIAVFRVEQFSGETEVLVDGTVNLPQVGSVRVEGLTIQEATNAISARYASILRRPLVTLSLLAPRPLEIGVAGEVNRPGSYTIPVQNAQFPTLTQVLKAAGGIRLSADLRQVQVRRMEGSGSRVINVDLWQLLQSGDPSLDPILRDGDNIFIPTSTATNLAELPQIADASFFSDVSQPVNVAVVGEVFRPGPYTLTGGTARATEAGEPGGETGAGKFSTVTRAIQVAGGIRPQADIREIEVRRPTRNGQEQVIKLDLWQLLLAGDLRQDMILQEGDTVYIPQADAITAEEATQVASASFSPSVIRVNVVGEVTSPGVVELTPNAPLNQALLAAGGFNNRASRGEVELIRLNPNGTVSQREIPVDFAEGVSEDNNPALRDNDVVVVSRSGIARVSDALDTTLRPLGSFLNLLSFPFRIFGLFD